MVKPKVQVSANFDPLSQGMFFFILWLIIRTNVNLDIAMEVISWLILGVSVVLFLSIFIPSLARTMRKTATSLITLFIFQLSLIIFALGWLGNINADNVLDLYIGIFFGFLWVVAYTTVIASFNKYYGIGMSIIYLAIGVYVLVVETSKLGGIILTAIAVILFLAALRIIPVIKYSIYDEITKK